MKIGIRGGHNPLCVGASALIDELTEDRKVYIEVLNYLKLAGHNVIDVTPSPVNSQGQDLSIGVNKANSNGVDLFVSIHFNKAYDSYDGAIGSEVWTYPTDNLGNAIANKVLKNLQDLGFKNRGVKDGKAKGLYEINKTSMTALIVEVCFVEATEDVALYNSLGAKRVALAIAEGIHGNKIVMDQLKKYYVVTDYIPQLQYGIEWNGFKSKYFNDIDRMYIKSNEKGIWVETQYLSKEKCEELKKRLGNLFWIIKEE